MTAKRFDVTLKHLFERYPADLPRYLLAALGLPRGAPVEPLDADVSTVTAAADKVFRVGGRRPWLLHVEVLAAHNNRLERNLLLYNVVLGDRHELPVQTVVLLLRRGADRRSITGVLRQAGPGGAPYLEFRYAAVRLWRQPVEPFLTGGLGLLPLAPLTDVPAEGVENVIRRMEERVRAGAAPAEAAELWTATYVLLGLQFSDEFAAQLLRGVTSMRESVTFQAILREGLAEGRARGLAEGRAEGRAEEARKILLRQGTKRFGRPDDAARAALDALQEIDHLEALTDRVLEASTWEDLLATPAPRRRNGRRRRTT